MSAEWRVCQECGARNPLNRSSCIDCETSLSTAAQINERRKRSWWVWLLNTLGILVLAVAVLVTTNIVTKVAVFKAQVTMTKATIERTYHQLTLRSDWQVSREGIHVVTNVAERFPSATQRWEVPPPEKWQVVSFPAQIKPSLAHLVLVPLGLSLVSAPSFAIATALKGQGSFWKHIHCTAVVLFKVALLQLGAVTLALVSPYLIIVCYLVIWYPIVRVAIPPVVQTHSISNGRAFITLLPLLLTWEMIIILRFLLIVILTL